MTAFFALIRKDLRLFFLDRRAVIMAFVAPILIGSFFGYVFGGDPREKELGKILVLVVDQDQGAVSKTVIERLRGDRSLAVELSEEAEARARVKRGKAPVAVVFPPKFSNQAARAMFLPGDKPVLRFLSDPSHKMEAAMVKGMLAGMVMEGVSKDVFTSDRYAAFVPPELQKWRAQLSQGAGDGAGGGMRVPFASQDEELTAGRTPYNAYAHAFGGMSIQFILFMGIDVGIGMLLDRQRGLWKRFASAPLSRWTLLGSRMVSATLIAMLVLAVVFTFARFAFNVRIDGSLPGFVAVCAAFGMMTSSYGLLIAALGKTPQAARGLSILATLLLVMLSGAWVPSFLFPAWLQSATRFIPTRWAMDGMDGMSWRGLSFGEALLPVAVLLGFSVVFTLVAVARFRWADEA
jgi:ABC-2 type transport system permease protein